jgi:Flp pilus assembly protein TadD
LICQTKDGSKMEAAVRLASGRWLSVAVLALSVGATPLRAEDRGNRADIGLQAATGGDEQSRALYLTLIRDMRDSGKIHAALAHLDAFDALYPHANDAAILRADCLVDLRDYAKASPIYRKLQRSDQSAAAAAGLGRIEALEGRWPAAVEQYARAIAIAPTSSAYLNDYGFALLRADRPADAVFRLRQAAELAPSDMRVSNNLILALAAAGDTADAQRMLAANPDEAQRAEIAKEIALRSSAAVKSRASVSAN